MRQCLLKGTRSMLPPHSSGQDAALDTFFMDSRTVREVDVIHTLDFHKEVDFARARLQPEGLKSMPLRINGVRFQVSIDQSPYEAERAFLKSCGTVQESGCFKLDTRSIGGLDNAVFAACIASRISGLPVQFTYSERGRRPYQTATVFKHDTPQEVFAQLKPVARE